MVHTPLSYSATRLCTVDRKCQYGMYLTNATRSEAVLTRLPHDPQFWLSLFLFTHIPGAQPSAASSHLPQPSARGRSREKLSCYIPPQFVGVSGVWLQQVRRKQPRL